MPKARGGIYAGLSATVWAKVFGTTLKKVRKLLNSKKTTLDRNLELEDIGEIIYEYKRIPREKEVDDLLDRWTGPSSL